MGCTQSKIENEATVVRCKERKQFMNEAVLARNAFSDAHFDYTISLKNTGAALSDYAHGEVRNPLAASSSALPLSNFEPIRPPPPPTTFPLQRAASMPEISTHKSHPKLSDSIIEEDDEEEIDNEETHSLKHRTSRNRGGGGAKKVGGEGLAPPLQTDPEAPPPPLPPPTDPESAPPPLQQRTDPEGGGGAKKVGGEGLAPPPQTDPEAPPPPLPPLTDPEVAPPPLQQRTDPELVPPPPPPESKGMTWDFFFSPMENVPGPSLAEVDEGRVEREEIERKMFDERSKRVEVVDGDGDGGVKRSVKKAEAHVEVEVEVEAEAAEVVAEKVAEPPPQPPTNAVKKGKKVAPTEGKRGGKSAASVNLLKIFGELDECFLEASKCAHEVSRLLEANRLHYHSNFVDNQGHTDHSARVMRVITWNSNRSFKGLPNADKGMNDVDSEEHETHATVLDKILAWEKKLYDEVKIGEQIKLEYQKKVASLDKLKKRATNIEAMEKTKAAVSHLHTKYTIDMQSIESTVSEINRLRDEQLYPKLVALAGGVEWTSLERVSAMLGCLPRMASMWETMRIQHEKQSQIVIGLKLLDISQSPNETSEHHHERTVQLWAVVQEWHSQFTKLVTYQKEYIKSLYNWLKLNLVPIDIDLKGEKYPFHITSFRS
ncbi:hypothetical protein TEA_017299 [Camellia sinensis var. sinensis]|uniref:DUF632 domain-containing protein n=1 Tax=Camellia sinensis var. sinensis TaxID=542762 RepID=A0A4S4DNU4_CAMSN|nr:hypothetical protein TEA_017299 [Camellia sinensis var. sinensis]